MRLLCPFHVTDSQSKCILPLGFQTKTRPTWCEGGNLAGVRERQALKEQTVRVHDVNA